MTLIELVIAIVIIGVGLVGIMQAYATLVKNSADPLIQKQMLAIAEEMMEEIMLKPYAPATNTAPANCARDTWNDIQDYNGYNTAFANCTGGATISPAAIYDISGSALPALSGYAVSVTVANTTLPANQLPPSPQSNPIPSSDAMLITVTVTHGSNSLQLLGWRTYWAQ